MLKYLLKPVWSFDPILGRTLSNLFARTFDRILASVIRREISRVFTFFSYDDGGFKEDFVG